MYRHRALEAKIVKLTRRFPAVLVTGPRQAGKTSLLSYLHRQLHGRNAAVVAFDTPSQVATFRRDPELFFANHPGPLLLDEIQNVPDIFPYLKSEIDRGGRKFRFFLTGSQHFPLMRGVSESLAGRVAVLDLWPFTAQEARGADPDETIGWLLSPESLDVIAGQEFPANDPQQVVPAMLAGGFPVPVLEGSDPDWFESYRRTYLQRDVRDLTQVADLSTFDRFLVLIAGRSGTVINKSEVAGALRVDDSTVDRWLSLLATSYQAFSLAPYTENATKRLVKRPKWVFADSGLALHLQAIDSTRALLNSPLFVRMFESFVLAEIRKAFGHAAKPFDAFFWRTAQGAECDLVLASGGRLVPIEIKHAASPHARDVRPMEMFLEQYSKRARHGILISMHPRVERVSRNIYNFPIGLLLRGLGAPPKTS